jgi:hypothetical protein
MIGKRQRFYVWLCWVFNFIGFNLTMVMMPEWYGISDVLYQLGFHFYRLVFGG